MAAVNESLGSKDGAQPSERRPIPSEIKSRRIPVTLEPAYSRGQPLSPTMPKFGPIEAPGTIHVSAGSETRPPCFQIKSPMRAVKLPYMGRA